MKFKFLCLFLLIMFIHNQACARVDLEETIGAWEIYTVVDEMKDSKYFRYVFTGSLFEGSTLGINPNNLSNIRPKVVSLSLDGFSKAYKRICKK